MEESFVPCFVSVRYGVMESQKFRDGLPSIILATQTETRRLINDRESMEYDAVTVGDGLAGLAAAKTERRFAFP